MFFLTKDVIEAIAERRSVRSFKNEPVLKTTLSRLIEVACMAPSAGNIQPWHFFLVLRDDVKQMIAKACYKQSFIGEAPAVIVVCALPWLSEAKYGQRGAQMYCLQDTAAAAQNILLAATGYGLGSCWVGSFNEEELINAVGGRSDMRPVAVIPIGFADDTADRDELRPVVEVTTTIE